MSQYDGTGNASTGNPYMYSEMVDPPLTEKGAPRSCVHE